MFLPGLIFGDVSASNGSVPPASINDASVSETGEFAIIAFGADMAGRSDGPVPGNTSVPLPPPVAIIPDGGLGAVGITAAEGEVLTTPVDGKQSRPNTPVVALLPPATPDLKGGQAEHEPVAETLDMESSDTSESKRTASHSDDAREHVVSKLTSPPPGAEMSEKPTPTRSNVLAVAETADAEAQPNIPSEAGVLNLRTGKTNSGERSEAAPRMSRQSGNDLTDKPTRAIPVAATMNGPRLHRENLVGMAMGADALAEEMQMSNVSRVAIPSEKAEIPTQGSTESSKPVSGASDRDVLQADAVRAEPFARSVHPVSERSGGARNTSQFVSVDSPALVPGPSQPRQLPPLSTLIAPPSERLESPKQPLLKVNPTRVASVDFQTGKNTVIGIPERPVHLAASQPAHSSLAPDERFHDHLIPRDLSRTVSAKPEAFAPSSATVQGTAAPLVVEPPQDPRIGQSTSDARRAVELLTDAGAPPKVINMVPTQTAIAAEAVSKMRPTSSAEHVADPKAVADGPHVLDMFSSEARLAEFAQRSETSTSTPRAPDLPRPAMNQIIDALRHAPGKVELTLSPEELGRVSLSLQFQDGMLSVLVHAERPETVDLIRRCLDILLQEARADGFEDVIFAFGDQGGTGEGPPGWLASEWQDEPPSTEPDPTSAGLRPYSPSDRLDMRL